MKIREGRLLARKKIWYARDEQTWRRRQTENLPLAPNAPPRNRPSNESFVAEQIRLLENVLWWSLLPPTVGILLVVVGNAGLSRFTLGYGAVVMVLGGGIYDLNQREVRTRLRPRREELTQLLHRFKERECRRGE